MKKKGGLEKSETSDDILRRTYLLSRDMSKSKLVYESPSKSSIRYSKDLILNKSRSTRRSRYYNEGNILKYTDELIPINLKNIYEILEPIYGTDIINECKNIINRYLLAQINKFAHTNNGVLLTKEENQFKGGGMTALYRNKHNLKPYEKTTTNQSADLFYLTFTDDAINSLIQTYCTNVKNDSEELRTLFNAAASDHSGHVINNSEYNKIKQIIQSSDIYNNQIVINNNPVYDYNRCNPSYNSDNNFSIDYTYYDYNMRIVTAYEEKFLNNVQYLNVFIDKQQIYINKLSLADKRILQDYTKNDSSFLMYNKWVSKSIDWENPEFYNIGDSFYPQIFKILLKEAGDNNDLKFDIYKQYISWLSSDRIGEKIPSKYRHRDSSFWVQVLEEFKSDLYNIIVDAPVCEEDLYFYRGITNHYIKDGPEHGLTALSSPDTVGIFKNTRFSSFTLDFKIAHKYHNSEPEPRINNCIYRINVKSGCKILYLPQLSLHMEEIEFLVPPDSVYIYKTESGGIEFKPVESTNNLYNPYGICSKKDNSIYEYASFMSCDVTLNCTPYTYKYTEYDMELYNYLTALYNGGEIPESEYITFFTIDNNDAENAASVAKAIGKWHSDSEQALQIKLRENIYSNKDEPLDDDESTSHIPPMQTYLYCPEFIDERADKYDLFGDLAERVKEAISTLDMILATPR
jgi:hypothetical protein